MQTNAELQFLFGPMVNHKSVNFRQQSKCHPCYLAGVEIAVPHWQPRHNHVGVAYSFNFVDVEVSDYFVEDCVKIIQEIYNLTEKIFFL